MSKWKDISSYSQNGPREVTSVELEVCGLRLVVTRIVHLEGWWMRVLPLGKDRQLTSVYLENAKAEALDWLRSWSRKLANELAEMKP